MSVGLSLSAAGDGRRYGTSPAHLDTVVDDLTVSLLVAGYRLVYGGMLGYPGAGPDYVERLMGLVRAHSPLLGGDDPPPLVHVCGWPISEHAASPRHTEYGRFVDLVELDRPDLRGVDPGSDGAAIMAAAGPAQSFAWARGMTAMREHLVASTAVRIALGGKLSGHRGRYPGVLEETLLTLRAGRPLLLIGAFGGGARLALDALRGLPRAELTTDFARERWPRFEAVRRLHQAAGLDMDTPEALASELEAMGRGGLARALRNGLDDGENERLAESSDPTELVELILEALEALA